ncbi:calcium-binding protein [Aestuariicoccus sp. MJ-SS9]|uniref:calcium-binding protein n=1 Tax=Aestuariicoccus sp. MJ-SS9 TaxID=3079855 RepID=UPI00290CC1FF|nr:calcium-binding protein [Aestuariicoccus sp. MJ-SS9]MDU8910676.1 calcium-binding protein [Aestuariicoccus sp. MJ-SS9]
MSDMATIYENGDSDYFTPPSQTMQVGDVFEGINYTGDFGDKVWVPLIAGARYTITMTGLSATDAYHIYWNNFAGDAGSISFSGGAITGTNNVSGAASDIEAGPGTVTYTLTPLVSTDYEMILARGSWADGDITYQIGVADFVVPTLFTDEADNVTGTSGADDYNMLRGDDTLDAGDGNDSVFGAHGADDITGGPGDDSLNGDNDNDVVSGGTGRDTLLGGNHDDTLSGGADDDLLNGGNGNDSLLGDGGADLLIGGKNDDILDGGAGADTLNGSFGNDTMTGGTEADVYVISASNGADVIDAFEDGVDLIDVTAIGVAGLGDMAISQAGADVLIDLGGGNQITLTAFDLADVDAGDFILAPDPTLGTAGDDMLIADDSATTIEGGEGADRIHGKAGNDNLSGGNGKDSIDGNEGDDTLDGGDGNDRMSGGKGADVMSGGARNDDMSGGAEADAMSGGTGNDALAGDDGDDTLEGGAGHDELSGGTGADTFVFSVVNGRDTLTDFEDGVDLLDVQALTLTGIADLTITQDGADALISLDGSMGNTVRLTGVDIADIDAADFLF